MTTPTDDHGSPLTAAESCRRCWHRWFDHDHAYAPVFGPGWDACLLCGCPGFTALAVPFPAVPTVDEAAAHLQRAASAALAAAQSALGSTGAHAAPEE